MSKQDSNEAAEYEMFGAKENQSEDKEESSNDEPCSCTLCSSDNNNKEPCNEEYEPCNELPNCLCSMCRSPTQAIVNFSMVMLIKEETLNLNTHLSEFREMIKVNSIRMGEEKPDDTLHVPNFYTALKTAWNIWKKKDDGYKDAAFEAFYTILTKKEEPILCRD